MQGPPNGRHLMVGDVRIHYLELAGEGPPMVVLPGITSPAVTWDFVARRLAGFTHVYTLDNRGRGLSSGGAHLPYKLEDYAADTAGVITQLGLDRPIVLGHSMGARIALRLAAELPELVGPLVLVDPPVTGPGRRPYPVPLQWYLDSLEAACQGEPTDRSNPLMQNWTDEQVALREQWLPTCDPEAIAQSYASFNDEDVHILMPEVTSPTLLIYAENGGTVTDDDAAEIRNLVPDCRSVRIDGVGHMIPWDDLNTFVDTVEGFVESTSGAQ